MMCFSRDTATTSNPDTLMCMGTGWKRSARDRFWEKVRIGDGCWEWLAAVDRHGYGIFSPDTMINRQWRAHRWAWHESNGAIPTGRFILHLCDNRRCVRLDHLTLGDHRQNMRERKERPKRDPRCKLSAVQEESICTRYRPGHPKHIGNGPDLMAEYGISRTTLYRILRGGSYAG